MSIPDPVLLEIVEGASTGGLPIPIAKAIHHTAHLLRAARGLDDVTVFAKPEMDSIGRFVVGVVGKWAITFVMAACGPDDLRLEKLAKSCVIKPNRFSPRHHQARS